MTFIPGIGPYDCPACGKAASAWGDSFCGKCEREFQEEMARQHEALVFGDAYLKMWGSILWTQSEIGPEYMERPENLPPVTQPEWAVGLEPDTIYSHRREIDENRYGAPEWVRQDRLRAMDEAIAQ